jgi:antiviral helicase SKI2
LIGYQVEVDAIVERHVISPMREALKSLAEIVEEWVSVGAVPEVEWVRMRSLNFQEVLRTRSELARGLDKHACTLCEKFEHHVGLSCSFLIDHADSSQYSMQFSMEKRS